ncbi:unnamed protein product [Staurois parvus]|uniref:Uncharacterized protein n=1 Tax=Staurois parvus TaxID=386267 RepID=A0ABN9B1G9_9NEOB|nr:unnamed protein product [Staurois parvus]
MRVDVSKTSPPHPLPMRSPWECAAPRSMAAVSSGTPIAVQELSARSRFV